MTPDDLAGLIRACQSTTGAAVWRAPTMTPIAWQIELGEVCDALIDSSLDGTGKRATLSAPPRHGKTEWTSRAMPIRAFLEAWRLGWTRDDAESPTFSIMYVTSTGPRAEMVSDQVKSAVRRIYRLTGDEHFAPGPIWTRNEWQTKGGLRWTATGWSSATGGIGANLLVMDDMIGSSEVYRSRSSRQRIRRVVQEDLLARLMLGGAAIQMETRRGIHDTTGWLLSEYPGHWERHVWRCYDPERGYLWPAVYGPEWRATMPHLTDASPVWRSLYQQEPIPEGGTLIEPEWLEAIYTEPPKVVAALADSVLFGVDLAATGKTSSDPCAFVVIASRGAMRDVVFAHQAQMTYPEARRYLEELAREWGCVGGVVELAANGDAMVADLASVVPGIRGERATKDKTARLTPHLPRMSARQVRLPRQPEPWSREYREVMLAFTGTDGDDDHLVDATVWALVASDTGAATLSAEDWLEAIG